jgi:DNA polymerase elongation subunit (family B)
MVVLQPCDWQEYDVKYKYTVDVFGRTADDDVVKVRLTGFCPYFYIKYNPALTNQQLIKKLEVQTDENNKQYKQFGETKFFGMKITVESKLDAMSGFSGLQPIKVWKISCTSLKMYKSASRAAEKLGYMTYENDLPPYIRLFHELNISPASPISFEADAVDTDDSVNVDVTYEVDYKSVIPCPTEKIAMYLAAYDIEVYSDSGNFPVATNPKDEVTQIGVSFRYSDDMLNSYKRVVLVNGTVDLSKDSTVEFIPCKNEKDLLLKFEKLVRDENPDAICGYNTFGFDDGYIAERANSLRIQLSFGRIDLDSWKERRESVSTEKKTFELASGKFAVRYFKMPGRLPIDLLLSVRREQNLDSYKLDNVSTVFLRDKVTNIVTLSGAKTRQFEIHTKSTRGLFVGNLVRFDVVGNTINPYADGMKFKTIEVSAKKFIIELEEHNYLCTFDDLSASERKNLEWSFTKDDVSVQDMFASHRGTATQRAEIAKYCIQDCDLVLTLMAKFDTLVNARGMADVCKVPIQYIFLRGQGIKIYSAVVYNASKRNQIIVSQENVEGDTSYEGAIVLPPKIGMYLDQPIPVLDFNSLYPSNMIAFNLSPDTLVYVKRFDENGKKLSQEGVDGKEFKDAGYTIDEIGYDEKLGETPVRTICGFVQPTENSQTVGILPLTLDILLKKRKETRKIMETIEDDAQKSVLNGLQLAYKVVANSVYGQCGSRTSPIRKLEVAACTTAAGRDRIQYAKKIVETEFGGEIVYGDTDSIFIKFQTKDLAESIELGKKAAERITSLCRRPYKIEYEKTFYPFLLFCRKRYVGMKYEEDIHKCKRMTMGVALKRRDNAPIVKDVFGGALDILMEKRDVKAAQKFVQDMLISVMKNEIPVDKYIITKQLRDDYKNPGQIAHRVLADRMEERDAGNKPQVGDRLSYIYVANRHDEKKQGDRIEHIDYVKQHKLKPDVEFYITNQIQNPVAQMFALAIDQLEGYKSKVNYTRMMNDYLAGGMDEEDATLAVLKQKEKEIEGLLFMGASYLTKHKRGPMDAFLGRK